MSFCNNYVKINNEWMNVHTGVILRIILTSSDSLFDWLTTEKEPKLSLLPNFDSISVWESLKLYELLQCAYVPYIYI